MVSEYIFVISPNNSERSMSGMFLFSASWYSGLSFLTAAVKITASACAMFSALCPIVTDIPDAFKRSVTELAVISEPFTMYPLFFKISANPLMLIPPIPIM